jgi:hypothetical protein
VQKDKTITRRESVHILSTRHLPLPSAPVDRDATFHWMWPSDIPVLSMIRNPSHPSFLLCFDKCNEIKSMEQMTTKRHHHQQLTQWFYNFLTSFCVNLWIFSQ